MAGNSGAAAQIGVALLEDYQNRGPQSAVCQMYEFYDNATGSLNPVAGYLRQLLCDPPPPPEPPESDFFDAGGVACRLYRVTVSTGNIGGAPNTGTLDRRGPIGLINKTFIASNGEPRRTIYLTSGTGVSCERIVDQIASSSNTDFGDVYGRIDSIVALEGDPQTEVPVYQPPLETPPVPPLQFNTEFNINVGGVEVTVPLIFAPVTLANFGPLVQVQFVPTANFNPQIDVDLGLNPRFALDLNLEFIIPIGGSPSVPTPAPGAEPIPLPPIGIPGTNECEQFDYQRIEDAILAARCCLPITDVQNVGTFTFETANSVARFDVPDNAVAVFIGIVPGDNTRVYKFAGQDSEYGHGNASATISGNAIQFERLYLNNHVLYYPELGQNKGVRISCAQGTIVTVNAGLYVPEETP